MSPRGGLPPRRFELGFVALALVGLGVVAFGRFVAEGGYSSDDWSLAALTEYPGDAGLLSRMWDAVSYRPVAVLYMPLPHLLFGAHVGAQLAWTVALGIAVSVLLYAVLRAFGVPWRHAAPVVALLLVYPHVDSTRLWITGGLPALAVLLALAGLLVAERGLARTGTRGRKVAMHAGAVTLYALAVFTYEAVAPAIALFGLLYRTRVSRRPALLRHAVDLAVTGAALGWVLARTPREPTSLRATLDHTEQIAREAPTLLARSIFPFGEPATWAVLAAAGAVAVAALALRRRQAQLRTPLRLLAVGVTVAVAGWIMFLPADPFYSPLSPGFGNRTNAISSVGLVMASYACVALLGTLPAVWVPRWRAAAVLAPAALAVVLLAGYTRDERERAQLWISANARARAVLDTVHRSAGRPPPGTAIYTFGAAGYVAPGVPVFAASWDLAGAVILHWRDPSLTGFPVLAGTSVGCAMGGVRVAGPGWAPGTGSRYGKSLFVDVPSETAIRVDSRVTCRRAVARFAPGP